jgi:mevalonate kinase
MTSNSKKYFGKILLFGEYTIIQNGIGLAIPYERYWGEWRENTSFEGAPELLNHLKNCSLKTPVDIQLFDKDLREKKGYFSTIPRGKGLGSSGALVAAVYDRYGTLERGSLKLEELQKDLAQMEGFYHGQSSGVDPLVSFLGCPVKVSPSRVEKCSPPLAAWNDFKRWALIDAQSERVSAPLVKIFRQKVQLPELQVPLKRLGELVAEGIDHYESADESHLSLVMEELSRLQWEYFQEMIPHSMREIWRRGLESREYFFKLCGAGGGGYFLVYRRSQFPKNIKFENF